MQTADGAEAAHSRHPAAVEPAWLPDSRDSTGSFSKVDIYILAYTAKVIVNYKTNRRQLSFGLLSKISQSKDIAMDHIVLAACIQAAAALVDSGRVPISNPQQLDDAIAQGALAIYSNIARMSGGRIPV